MSSTNYPDPGDISALASAIIALRGRESRDRVAALMDRVASVVVDSEESVDRGPLLRSICGIATEAHPWLADVGQRLLFSTIAEPLGDAFTASAVRRYNSIFAEVIDSCRLLPEGLALRDRLSGFGIRGAHDLRDRMTGLASPSPIEPGLLREIQKVVVLSRVTVGADVAVTSLVLQKLERHVPHAQRILIGSTSPDLFSGEGRTRVMPLSYGRRGGLLQRFTAWTELVDTVDKERAGLASGEFLVIDPDSRLTQLGLLPVVHAGSEYRFFESRSYQRPGRENLGELMNDWLQNVFGPDHEVAAYPRVCVATTALDRAESLVSTMRRNGARHVVTVNLGVGGNPRKRIAGAFELDLVTRLLSEGSLVILDYGSPEEKSRLDDIALGLERGGYRRGEASPEPPGCTPDPTGSDFLTYRGGIGGFAALIATADLYVGYDSAFQHIAGALGVPALDIFVDPPNTRFLRRWTPHSRATVRTIHVSSTEAADEALTKTLQAYQSARESTSRVVLTRAE